MTIQDAIGSLFTHIAELDRACMEAEYDKARDISLLAQAYEAAGKSHAELVSDLIDALHISRSRITAHEYYATLPDTPEVRSLGVAKAYDLVRPAIAKGVCECEAITDACELSWSDFKVKHLGKSDTPRASKCDDCEYRKKGEA